MFFARNEYSHEIDASIDGFDRDKRHKCAAICILAENEFQKRSSTAYVGNRIQFDIDSKLVIHILFDG